MPLPMSKRARANPPGHSVFFLLSVAFFVTVCGCSNQAKSGNDSSIPNGSGKNVAPEYFVKAGGHRPFGVAIHGGIMYMVTAPASGNGELSRITPDGRVEEFAKLEGSFSGNYLTDKSFISSGIDFDDTNNAYLTLGDRLIKIAPDGTVTTIADGFARCFDVKIDKQGNIYVADDKADTIYRFTPSMEKSVLYKGKVTGDFVLTSLALDAERKRLFAREGRRILQFKLNQSVSPAKPLKPKCVVDGIDMFTICLDKDDTIYACTSYSIIRIDGKAKSTTITSSLRDPDGLCFGASGFDSNTIYVAAVSGIMKVRLR